MINQFETHISPADIEASSDVLRSGWIGPGKVVEEFEGLLCEATGRKYAVCFNSGTSALLMAIKALYVGNNLVNFPAYGMPAGRNAIWMAGKFPHLVDVGPTFHMEYHPNLSSSVIVNHNGHPYTSASMLDCQWLEDAATSIGVSGAFIGTISTLSFSPHKLVTTGQGGAALTDDESLAGFMRAMANQGKGDSYDGVSSGNFRMSDINAAVGVSQIKRLAELCERREEIHGWYSERLDVDCGWQVVLRSREAESLSKYLHERGIPASRLYGVNSPETPGSMSYPNAEIAAKELLYLPSHLNLKERQVSRICEIIQEYDE